MAIIKKNELIQMKEPQIKEKLNELKQELMRLNAQRATHTTPTNPGRIKAIRRTIASLLTILNMAQLKIQGGIKKA